MGELTKQMVLDLAKGKARRLMSGQVIPCQLQSKDEWAVFELAQRTGILVMKGRHEALENVWFSWCSVSSLPYVVARQKRRYARVKYDLIESPHYLSKEGCNLVKNLFRTHGRLGTYWSFGCIYGDVELEAEDADDVAGQLLNILRNPKYRVPRLAPPEDDIS
jgi:hypothetical protein